MQPRSFGLVSPNSQICNKKSFRLNSASYYGLIMANYTEYDICSILHYPGAQRKEDWCPKWITYLNPFKPCKDYCAVTEKYTRPCLIKGEITYGMGQRLELSESDIRGINIRYGCKGYG